MKKECVDTRLLDGEIIRIKKLKKDSSIGAKILDTIIVHLQKGNCILIPVDSIYGFTGLTRTSAEDVFYNVHNIPDNEIIRIVSSFKMVEEVADITKEEFDFLHRVWPDEVIVKLRKKGDPKKRVLVRFPKNRYLIDLLTTLDRPLFHVMVRQDSGKPLCSEAKLIQEYSNEASLILIIKEFCRSHSQPSIIDISDGELNILSVGKIPAEELQSLYFLNTI